MTAAPTSTKMNPAAAGATHTTPGGKELEPFQFDAPPVILQHQHEQQQQLLLQSLGSVKRGWSAAEMFAEVESSQAKAKALPRVEPIGDVVWHGVQIPAFRFDVATIKRVVLQAVGE